MWYVFPQVRGLGVSAIAQRYAIASVEEAMTYFADPLLGAHYRRVVDAVWHQVVERGVTIRTLFGSPDDAKLVSSLTLFAGVAHRVEGPEPPVRAFLDQAAAILASAHEQGLAPCAATARFLAS